MSDSNIPVIASFKSSMVCGIDCKIGKTECSGYCVGKSAYPNPLTAWQTKKYAKIAACAALANAEIAWDRYYSLCKDELERTQADKIREHIKTAIDSW
jgi:tRNA-dihydrouridine synthase